MTGQSWPATFADALDTLDGLIPTATKQYLSALDEPGLDREHWGLGLAIRNVLGLWREDAPLTRWFASRGFIQSDDMAGEVLRAYWRRLRGLEAAPEPFRLTLSRRLEPTPARANEGPADR
jgi:uncharacterized protein DUF6794